MPYRINLDNESKVILVEIYDAIRLADILSFIAEIMEEPYLSLPYGVLADFRNASLTNVFYDDVTSIYQFLKANQEKVQPFNLAALASGKLEFGLNRTFEMMSDDSELPFRMLVTTNEEAAWRWAVGSAHP